LGCGGDGSPDFALLARSYSGSTLRVENSKTINAKRRYQYFRLLSRMLFMIQLKNGSYDNDEFNVL
jgi:hypothetical protein